MKRLAIALPILALFFAGAAQATVLYDNIGATTTDNDPANPGTGNGPLADSFSTLGSPFDLNSLELKIGATSEGDGGILTVNLLSDNSAAPGTLIELLGTFNDSDLSGGFGSIKTVSGFAAVTLSANTRYWIQLTGTGSAFWDFSSDISGTGVSGERSANKFANTLNTKAAPYQMFIGETAVPEPLTLSLLGAGLACAAAVRRRKAK